MLQLEQTIADVVASVWENVLGVHVESDGYFQPKTTAATQTFAGVVQICGAWNGAVVVQCSDQLARRAAVVMLGVSEADLVLADVQDTLGELANMTGGNIKALMPEPSTLGMPVVIEGLDFRFRMPGSAPIHSVAFRVGDEAIVVSVLEHA